MMKRNSLACEHNAMRHHHVTRKSAQPAHCLRPQCSRPEIVHEPHPWRARNTLESGDSIFFPEERIVVLFTGCECKLLGPRLIMS